MEKPNTFPGFPVVVLLASWGKFFELSPKNWAPLGHIPIMKKYTLRSGVFFSKNFFRSLGSQQILRFISTTNHKTAVFGRNFLYRSLVTDKTVDKKKVTKTVATDVVKNSAYKLTGAQVRDLTQTLIRLKDRELARQEKRQTGKHLHDANIKGFSKTIELLTNLLKNGYNPGRYSYDEKDFSYTRPARTLTQAQKERNLDNLAKAREAKAKLAAENRTDHD